MKHEVKVGKLLNHDLRENATKSAINNKPEEKNKRNNKNNRFLEYEGEI